MAKKIIQDIVKKTNIAIRKKVEEAAETAVKKGHSFKKVLFVLAIILIFVLIGFALVNFSWAEIKIVPHQQTVGADSNFTLGFKTIQMAKDNSQVVKAQQTASAGQKASGQIIIYNIQDTSQKLIEQTRFEAASGKIYRIQKAVVIPAHGSTETTAYADQPGPEYNIGLVDFTVPGLKGTSRYGKVFGRSKTAMMGGANQGAPVVSLKDLDDAKNSLKDGIKKSLLEEMNKQKPDIYFLYDNAVQINFSEDINGNTVKETGSAVGYLLKKDDLLKILADKYLSNLDSAKVTVANLQELGFALISVNNNGSEINFNLKGQPRFVWKINTDSVADSLLVSSNKNYVNVFKNFPEIEKAEIIFHPSWWRWLPSNKSRIKFEITL